MMIPVRLIGMYILSLMLFINYLFTTEKKVIQLYDVIDNVIVKLDDSITCSMSTVALVRVPVFPSQHAENTTYPFTLHTSLYI